MKTSCPRSVTFQLLMLAGLAGCQQKAPPEPESTATRSQGIQTAAPKSKAVGTTSGGSRPGAAGTAAHQAKTKALTEYMRRSAARNNGAQPTPSDPEKGDFTLEEATVGLSGTGALSATIDTDLGKMTCELYADKAPVTVANFVGLARGLRPWKENGAWVKKPIYDGSVFHRIIKGFMIQGGDPEKSGKGGPGYQIKDEIWPGAKHDRRGLLCMANRGPNTNGSQFFIMDAAAAHLDGGYTIFGKCSPDAVIEKIAGVQLRGPGAAKPPVIRKVSIQRAAK